MATSRDASEVAAVFRRSREAAMPWLPVLHTPAEDLEFFRSQLVGHGFAVAGEGWLHHLYIEPDLRGRGMGSALLDEAKDAFATGLLLWVFERNGAARVFYEARGFLEVERTDGAGNEEKEPDVLMRWDPSAVG
jgi:putative acetyltransferase